MLDKNDSLHPQSNFDPAIASGINERPAEGVDLDELPVGTVLELQTGHHSYSLENRGNGNALISGHPTYCPEPTAVEVQGSVGSNGALRWHFIGKGRGLVFMPPDHGIIRTSAIKEIHARTPDPVNSN